MGQCLDDQHSIEWVAVRSGQSPGALGVRDRDRKLLEALTGNGAGDVADDRLVPGQLEK